MKINKVVILSAILLSSVAGAMKKKEEKKYNPNTLSTLSTLVIGANPDRATVSNMQYTDDFCHGWVTRICENPEIPLNNKIQAIAFWEKQEGLTEQGKKQIEAVKNLLTKAQIDMSKGLWNPESVDFVDVNSIGLNSLFHKAIGCGAFKPRLVQFVLNLAGSQIAQNPVWFDSAIRHSKEPAKSVQCLLDNGANPQALISKRVRCPVYGCYRQEQVKVVDIAKETAKEAKKKKHIDVWEHHFIAPLEEYDKTIELLEQAKLNEIYSGISRLFEQN